MDFRPQRTANTPIDEAFRQAFDLLYSLRARVDAIPPAARVPTYAQIRDNLQATGSAPLNVQGLSGTLAELQNAIIPTVSVLPETGVPGQAVRFQNDIWTWNGSWSIAVNLILQGTRAVRVATLPTSLILGTLFFETDTEVLYLIEPVKGVPTWTPILAAQISDVHAHRMARGIVNVSGVNVTWVGTDTDTQFDASWVGQQIWIASLGLMTIATVSSPTTLTLTVSGGTLVGAVFLFQLNSWHPWFRPVGNRYYESDRGIEYVVADATGLCDTTGTTVTITPGTQSSSFNPYWTGQGLTITINGIDYTISAVVNQNQLTLSSSAGNQIVKTFTIKGAAWRYETGVLLRVLTAIPTDLGGDDLNFRLDITDFFHSFNWQAIYSSGAWGTWAFTASDPGSGWIVASTDQPPLGGLWAQCLGTSVQIMQSNATLLGVATPNLGGGVFIEGGTTYSGTVNGPVAATWQPAAETDIEDADHIHGLGHTTTTVHDGTGAAITVVNSVDTLTGVNGTVHHHPLTNALSTLYPPDEARGGLPKRIQLIWYMRL